MAEWRPITIAGEGNREFALRSPMMPAAGFLGYGRAYPGLLDPRLFGALVTQATTLHPRGARSAPVGAGLPRSHFARTRGGFILPVPAPNPGIGGMLRLFAPSWRRWQVPVIVALWLADAEEATSAASRLEEEESVSGVELQVPPEAGATWLKAVANAFRQRSDLPLLVKLPLAEAAQLADAAVASGAAALVLGTPHYGAQPLTGLYGPLYGPATLPYTLRALQELGLGGQLSRPPLGSRGLPLIASGGIYTAEDADLCLQSGAQAVQLDGIIPLDPTGAAEIARRYAPLTSTASG